MALSNPRSIFGIHQISPYNLETGEFYGTMRVLGSSTLSLSSEQIDLMGGSSRYPYDSEIGPMTSEMKIVAREYPDWAFELFLGKKPTRTAASTISVVSTATNVQGTSIINATNGISSVDLIALTGDDNAKFGNYIIKAVTPTSVEVYVSTNINFDRGTDAVYEDDLLKITAAPIVIAIGTNPIPAFGLDLTGIGVSAFTVGDTASFTVDIPHKGKMDVVIGGVSDIFPKFGCMVYAQKKGNGGLFQINCFNVQAAGLPIGFTEKEFSEAEISAKLLFSSAKNGVFRITALD